MKPRILKALVGLGCLAVPFSLSAHTGHATPAGFLHPLAGLDHLLAALAIGLWATQMEKGSLWKLPTTFLLFMTLGMCVPFAGITLLGTTWMIPLTVIGLGTLILVARGLNANLAIGFAGCFALYHGFSHGADLTATQGNFLLASGFILSTALLHATGVGLGLLAQKAHQTNLLRPAGAAIAVTGLVMMIL